VLGQDAVRTWPLVMPLAALTAYETALKDNPNRYRGLFGAARAAEKLGDRQKAAAYFGKLVALSGKADTERPEMRIAKAFLRTQ
jgi:tetratricopeptide (TPR) repeat protein